MAALLSVERNNTDKVGQFVAECRRMEIEILPPDVNRSGLDFTIETAGRAIRFGLGAVKNVGEGPVEAILAAREQGGPFENLDDFCQRVDLRQVNRRALECLIKVGALDAFGRRAQLLPVIDRMVDLSQSTHTAKAAGQISMFDEVSGLSQVMGCSLTLPDVPDVPRKELLSWEKELVGFYVSEHPLQQVAAKLDGVVTTSCGEIDEEMAGQRVVIAGVVAWIRPYVTKKENLMAFVQLEDLQGSVEVIVFPSIYEKTRELWEEDKILLIKGRVDTKGRGAKVICESVQDELVINRPADGSAHEKRRPRKPINRTPSPGRQKAGNTNDKPQPTAQDARQARQRKPALRHLRITIHRTGEQKQDSRRLGLVHSLLQSYEGEDRFSIYLVSNGRRVQLDFPNATTGYCPALKQALTEMLGAGAIRVD
jgi:DNA polymerase-3 subunit alpha